MDGDGNLSKPEIKEWISQKMFEHFNESERENTHIFKHLDPDQNGFIKWKEYYVHFLLSRGFDLDKSQQHVKDYDDSVKLEPSDKVSVLIPFN